MTATHGKTDYSSSNLSTSIENHVKIQLWYSEPVSRWRWSLTSDVEEDIMESGDSAELREAMSDIAVTVEWLLDRRPQVSYN